MKLGRAVGIGFALGALCATGGAALYLRGEGFAERVRDGLVGRAAQLGVDLSYTSLRVSILPPEATVVGLVLRTPGEPAMLRVERVTARIELTALLSRELRVEELRLERPRVAIRFDEDMRPAGLPDPLVRLLGLAPEDGAPPPEPPPDDGPPPLRVTVERVRLEGARVLAATDSGIFVDVEDLTAAFFGHGGLYSLDARLRGGLLQTPDVSQELREVRIEAALRPPEGEVPGELHVAALRLETHEVTLEGRGRITTVRGDGLAAALALGPTNLTTDGLDLELRAPLGLVERALPGVTPHLDGHVSADVHVAGLLARPRVTGALHVTGAVVDTYTIGDLDAEVDADPAGVRVQELRLHQPAADVRLSAALAFDEHLTLSIRGRAERVAFGPLLEALDGPHSIVVFDGTADFELAGPLRAPDGFALSGHAVAHVKDFAVLYDYWRVAPRTPNILDFPEGSVTTGLRIDPAGIHYLDALIEVGGTRLHVNGGMGYPPDGHLDLHATSDQFDLGDLGTLVGLEIAGRGRLRANVVGPYAPTVQIDGDLDLVDTRFAGHPLGHATAHIEENDGHIDFTQLTARVRGTEAEAHGSVDVNTTPATVDWELDRARGRIEDALAMLGPLEALLVPEALHSATGELTDARGHIGGTTERVGSELELVFGPSDLPAFTQKLDSARVELVAPIEGGVVILPSEVRRGDGIVRFSGEVEPNGRMRITGRSAGLRLEHIDSIALPALSPAGDAALEFDWHGRTTHPEVHATLALADTLLRGVPLGDSLATLTLDGDQLRIEGPLLGGALHVEAGTFFRGELPYYLTVELASTQLDALAPVSGPRTWRAVASGKVEAKGLLKRMEATSADLRLTALELFPGPPGIRFTNEGPIEVHVDGAGFSVRQLVLAAPRARLELSGGRAAGSDLDLGVRGSLDAAMLPQLLDWVGAAEGRVEIDARIGGTPEAPVLLGEAKLDAPRVRVKQFAQPLTDVTGTFGFGTGSVTVNDVTAHIGDGRVKFDGDVGLASAGPDVAGGGPRLRLRARVDRVRLAIPEEIPSVVSGELALMNVGGERLPVLSGVLRVDEARYTKNLSLLDKALEAIRRRPITPTVLDPEREQLRFDVTLRADRTLRVRNNRMDIDLSGDLRITGTNQRVGLVGVVEAVRGRVEEREHTYRLRRGRVEFTDPDAVRFVFDVVAETELRGTVADTTRASQTSFFGAPPNPNAESVCRLVVSASGTPESYETHFASPNCAYSEEELKHWLATGSPREADPLHALSNVGIDVLMDVSGIDRELRRLVPGARLRVSNVFRRNARSNADTVTQVALEWQATERLRLEFATALTQDEPDQRLRVEGRLGRVSSLQLQAVNGGQSQIADFGLDLKLRWEY